VYQLNKYAFIMSSNLLQQKKNIKFTFYYTDIFILKTELTNTLFTRYFVLSIKFNI